MGNYRLLKSVYQAYARGDAQAFLDAMHDDVVMEYCAPADVFRFAGPLRGKAEVVRGIGQIAEEYEWLKFNLNHLLTDGDLAIALTSGRIRHRHSTVELKVDMVDVIRLKSGKIVDLKEYFDSLGVLKKIGFNNATMTELAARLQPGHGLVTPADGLARKANP
jgi:ketosteroid isomerase-like protein